MTTRIAVRPFAAVGVVTMVGIAACTQDFGNFEVDDSAVSSGEQLGTASEARTDTAADGDTSGTDLPGVGFGTEQTDTDRDQEANENTPGPETDLDAQSEAEPDETGSPETGVAETDNGKADEVTNQPELHVDEPSGVDAGADAGASGGHDAGVPACVLAECDESRAVCELDCSRDQDECELTCTGSPGQCRRTCSDAFDLCALACLRTCDDCYAAGGCTLGCAP